MPSQIEEEHIIEVTNFSEGKIKCRMKMTLMNYRLKIN
jgi:hypothetical protein